VYKSNSGPTHPMFITNRQKALDAGLFWAAYLSSTANEQPSLSRGSVEVVRDTLS
jgi:hypothetical protein